MRSLLMLTSLVVTLGALTACQDDPGRSFLSRGYPQPVGDVRTTQRGTTPTNERHRAALDEPRIDDRQIRELKGSGGLGLKSH